MKNFIIVLGALDNNKKAKREIWDSGNMDSIILNEDGKGFTMRTKHGAHMPWTPSNKDIFADDWAFMDRVGEQ
jgi:hypothetical protein